MPHGVCAGPHALSDAAPQEQRASQEAMVAEHAARMDEMEAEVTARVEAEWGTKMAAKV